MKWFKVNRLFGSKVAAAYGAAALLLCASCTKDIGSDVPSDGAISIESTIAGGEKVKAIATTETSQSGVVLLRVESSEITAPTSFATNTLFTANRAAGGNMGFTSDPVPYYNKNNHYAYFIAFHPAGTSGTGTRTWSITNGGLDDIILTQTPWSAGNYASPVKTGMSFDHQLAHLQVKCVAASGEDKTAIDAVWGNITKIELLTTSNLATLTLATRAMSFSGSTSLQLGNPTCSGALASTAIQAAGGTAVTAAGMFAPKTGALKLKVYTDKITAGKEVEVTLKDGNTSVDFIKGSTHTITLGFKVANIRVLATEVTPWDDGGKIGRAHV